MGVRELGNPLGNPLGLARGTGQPLMPPLQFRFSGTSANIPRSAIPYDKYIITGIRQNQSQGSSLYYMGVTSFADDGSFALASSSAVAGGCVDIVGLPSDAKIYTIMSYYSGEARQTLNVSLPAPVDTSKSIVSVFFRSGNNPANYLYSNLFASFVDSQTVKIEHGSNAAVTLTFFFFVQVAVLKG